MEKAAQSSEGTSVHNIHLVRLIGKGGMGEVYEGFDRTLQRKVAVKVIHKKRLSHDRQRKRFLREAQILSQLDHPNICRVHNYLHEASQDYLILELVEGKTLKAANAELKNYPQRIATAIAIARAVTIAHSMNIIHRDLKLENIMITGDNSVKVLDFGLACSTTDNQSKDLNLGIYEDENEDRQQEFNASDDLRRESLSETGEMRGTLPYMSPEQVLGRAVTTASDIYAMGLVFQELFTGKSPYDPDLPYSDLLKKVMASETLPVMNLDRELTTLINTMKSHSPGQRPSADSVLKKLFWIQERPKRRLKKLALVVSISILFVATLVSSAGFFQAERAKKEALGAKARAEYVTHFMQDMLTSADPSKEGIEVKVVDILNLAASKLIHDESKDVLSQAAIHHALGQTYHAIGKHQMASQQLQDALAFRAEYLAPNDIDLISTLILLSSNQAALGDYLSAENYAHDALNRCQESLPWNHTKAFEARHALIISLHQQDRNEEAERECRDLLAAMEQQLGPGHEQTLEVMSTLGGILFYQNQVDQALSLTKKLIERRSLLLGEDHPHTLISRNNLAFMLMANEEYSEAEPIFRLCLSSAQKIFGLSHPMTLTSMNNLGRVLDAMGRFNEAEKLHREALEQRTVQLGARHPSTAVASFGLAKSLQGLKQYQEAESAYMMTLEIEKTLYGEKHESTRDTMTSIAELHREQGHMTQAEQWYTYAVEAGDDEAKNALAELRGMRK